ncbi:MAG: hypothetical protein KTR31_18570 [Myxococcales bacterium]|nr:hypothetical protein [Myxococcales bacterium]
MNADGTDDRFVTHNIHDDVFPAWSADGNHLVYTTMDPDTGSADVAVVDLRMPVVEPEVIVGTVADEWTNSGSWGR